MGMSFRCHFVRVDIAGNRRELGFLAFPGTDESISGVPQNHTCEPNQHVSKGRQRRRHHRGRAHLLILTS